MSKTKKASQPTTDPRMTEEVTGITYENVSLYDLIGVLTERHCQAQREANRLNAALETLRKANVDHQNGLITRSELARAVYSNLI